MIFRAASGQTLAALLVANVLIWSTALHLFQSRQTLLGVALLAWVLGLRHAMDADHIGAIDNVVRKLVHGGRRAWGCGLFFAIGHSATVLAVCAAIIAFPSVHGLERLRAAADDWGTVFSASFLLLIGLTNLLTLRRLWHARDDRSAAAFSSGGALSRVLRPAQRLVGRSWHM